MSNFERRKPAIALTREQQEELSRAAIEAMERLNQIIPPILAQFQALAQAALPALRESFKPMAEILKAWGMTAGEMEAAVRGEQLADEMKEGFRCMRCAGFVRVAHGYMESHNRLVHGKETR